MIRRRAAIAAVLAACAALLPALPAAADPTPSIGTDVSRYQCGRPWPGGQAFAVIAVNTGVPTGSNPCLAEQLALAATSPGVGHPALEVYVSTADPDPEQAAWWPSSDRTRRGSAVRTPYGRCSGGATRACAWVYGASLAADDLEIRGVPAGLPARWWLDVEAANSWSGDTARNRAVLEGMTARFTAAGARVGLYALSHEFRDLIGAVPDRSALSRLPSWLAGAADLAGAQQACSREPLASGRVLLTQWATLSGTDRLDLDLACTALPAQPEPRITGTHRVGARLTAHGGTADVHLAYRWLRDGAALKGATGATHVVGKKEAGHRISVRITSTAPGSSRVERTSASVRIPH